MAAQTLTQAQSDRFGRTTMKLMAAALFALIALSTVLSGADARKVTTTLGQNEFVNMCRDNGGTSKSVGTRVVQCTTADGTVVTCDFNTSPASCTIPFKPAGSNAIVDQVSGNVLEVADPGPSSPTSPIVDQTVSDGVLVQAEQTSGSPAIVPIDGVFAEDEVVEREPVVEEQAPAGSGRTVFRQISDEERP